MKKLIPLVFILMAGHALADDLTTFDFDVSQGLSQNVKTKVECKFDNLFVPENAVVYAVGAYSGKSN